MKKITKIGDEYEETPYKVHLCKHCRQLVIIDEKKTTICPNCGKEVQTGGM